MIRAEVVLKTTTIEEFTQKQALCQQEFDIGIQQEQSPSPSGFQESDQG